MELLGLGLGLQKRSEGNECHKIYISVHCVTYVAPTVEYHLPITSGLQRLAGVHDPPESCDIPKNADFYGDCDGGGGGSGNGQTYK